MRPDTGYEWNGIADFLGRMILKYADKIDFDSLPDPERYLTGKEMFAKYSKFAGLSRRLRMQKNISRDWKFAVKIEKNKISEKTDNIDII